MRPRESFPVVESVMVVPGQMVFVDNTIAMHPLDMIAWDSKTISERLARAMGWCWAQADRKFDAAIARLERGIS